jgi:DNA helicase-2/ATP-dependent DNA helicase PcrA
MMDLLANLNPQQQQAVMAGLGPVLVMAGPGSGKTRVLTRRVAYLVGAMGVRPYSILAVTFTNKAAREMESRVSELVGAAQGLTLGTFHAVCARLLRREAEHLPFQDNFVIFDQDDQLDLVKRAILDLNLDEKRYKPAGIHNTISNAKNEMILPDQFPVQNYRDEVVRKVYKRYQELLLANNALDFDDLLLWTALLLEENLIVREKYARRYMHILVDEFQDTNMVQYKLLRHLASFHHNLFVVGDADQSIYRWRGADYRNVLRFEQDFPNAQVILLEQNYRSTQYILDLAMAVIDRNPHRTPKRLFTDRGEGQKASLYEATDDRAEATFITDTIRSLRNRQQVPLGDVAVMYRTNAQSRLLEEAFLQSGMPYKLVGAQKFYGRREIKDVIAYLRLAHNPSDEISLTRVLKAPPRGIGDKTYLALRTQAQKLEMSPGALLIQMGRAPDSVPADLATGRARAALANFGGLLANWTAAKASTTPLELMDRILNETQYQTFIDDGSEEGHDRWDNLLELRRLASEFQEPGLDAFLERVALVSDQDTLDAANAQQNAATLLTLHAAKGLEYPVVFIAGLNDGVLPHSRSFEDPEAMLEEVRLLYVGVTRAKDRLYLTFSQNRAAYGGYAEPAIPSRFLDSIPYEMVEEVYSSRPRERLASGGRVDSRPERWGEPVKPVERDPSLRATPPSDIPSRREAHPTEARQRPPAQQRFSPGMHVEHPTWGEGMVLNSKLQDGDEIVDVHFAGIGLKRLVASLAPLTIKV